MKKRIVSLLLCLAMGASLVACGSTGDVTGSGETSQGGKKATQVSYATKELPSEEMATTNFGNSILITDMTYDTNGGNVMFSPLSLNFALGMVLEGTDADSPSRAVLEQYLSDENYSAFAKSYMAYAQTKEGMPVPEGSTMENHFSIANAVWMNQEYKLTEAYQKNVTDFYQAEVQNLDFGKPSETAKTINAWVSDKTRKMIPEIINAQMITPLTRAVLTNAIYFESPWTEEWELQENPGTFTNLDGSATELTYMDSQVTCGFFSNDKATGFAKKYSNGLEFIGILPREEGEFELADLDLEGLLASRESVTTTAIMPELNFDTNITLTEMLKALGMDILFSDSADITEMCDVEVKISEILQKTKLELDAKGTKAAAVTAVLMVECTSVQEPRREEVVILDRPFAFLIYDAENQVPVFMGKVTNLSE